MICSVANRLGFSSFEVGLSAEIDFRRLEAYFLNPFCVVEIVFDFDAG